MEKEMEMDMEMYKEIEKEKEEKEKEKDSPDIGHPLGSRGRVWLLDEIPQELLVPRPPAWRRTR
jgi:hypothetical protein